MIIGKQYIKEVALDCGFKLKEQPNGELDLNPYVYTFADKLIKQTHISLLGDFKDTIADVTSQIDDTLSELKQGEWIMSKIDNKTALNEIMFSHEKREALVSSVKCLANDVTALKSKQDIYKDDVSATAEALGIPLAKLNQFVKAYNDDLESVLGELTSTVDVLEILNEGVN